jgi:UDP-GlcNAc:undecaprenyl-phosphate GlcNAc-1-phosphate transferase
MGDFLTPDQGPLESINWLIPVVFLLSASLIGLLLRPAQTLNWVDHPCTRKRHGHPTPLVGGVGMFLAFCIGVLLLPVRPDDLPVLLGGMTLLMLVGLYDDIHHLRPVIRFLIQGSAVLLMAFVGHLSIGELGNLFGFGGIHLDWLSLPFTIIGVIGVINAMNMIDGLDGLAGGTALIAVFWLLVFLLGAPLVDHGNVGVLLVLAMAIVGFLVHNIRHPWRARATVFMGDAGSTMLGFVLGWFLVDLSQGQRAVMDPITAVWILAIPLMDTVSVMVRRVLAGQSPCAADRRHLHHLLLDSGLSHGRVVAVMLGLTFVLGGLGVLADALDIPSPVRFYAFFGLSCLYLFFTAEMAKRHCSGLTAAPAVRAFVPPDVPLPEEA